VSIVIQFACSVRGAVCVIYFITQEFPTFWLYLQIHRNSHIVTLVLERRVSSHMFTYLNSSMDSCVDTLGNSR
jgi:hypothetical protein